MYRISVEMPDGYLSHVKFLLNWSEDFEDAGILLGENLPLPDLRLVHHAVALKEWMETPGRIDTPLIIYERADQAGIQQSTVVRELLSHQNVRICLKYNTFRDYRLNNEPHLSGYWHYAQFLKYPALGLDRLSGVNLQTIVADKPVDAVIDAKVRLLPIVPADRFDSLYAVDRIYPPAERDIDINFAGEVDYLGVDPFLPLHRRAAARSIVNMRHLRALIGINGSVRRDIYLDTLHHSKISVSPWGYGEYSYRDYESVLCGCVMVKPDTDHVRTFAPDLYQSGKYYVPCRPDFEDLPEIVAGILADYPAHFDMASRAREDLRRANSRRSVVAYFINLFDSLRFNESDPSRLDALRARNDVTFSAFLDSRESSEPIIDLRTIPAAAIRCDVTDLPDDALAVRGERPVRISEDLTADESHDVRLVATAEGGSYELIAALRPRERRRVCVIVHNEWQDQFRIMLDLDSLETSVVDVRGDTFRATQVRCRQSHPDWRFLKAKLKIRGGPVSVGVSVGLVDDQQRTYYDGDGFSGVDLGILSLYPIIA